MMTIRSKISSMVVCVIASAWLQTAYAWCNKGWTIINICFRFRMPNVNQNDANEFRLNFECLDFNNPECEHPWATAVDDEINSWTWAYIVRYK